MLLALMVVGGCRPAPPPPFDTWSAAPAAVDASDASNAFSMYVAAGRAAAQTGTDHLSRVSFTPGQRRKLIADVGPSVRQVRRATRLPCRVAFAGRAPFGSSAEHQGWRLIGRVFVWNVQGAVAAGNYDVAVAESVAATRFAFDLVGGDALEASFGFALADDVRRALTPALARLSASQLSVLADGMQSAYTRLPSMDQLVAHETLNMRMSVQAVQDAYRSEDWAKMSQELGKDSRDAIAWLRELRKRDGQERVEYFRAFAAEIDAEMAFINDQFSKPVAARANDEPPSLQGHRPWKRFARHFFRTLRPLVPMRDETVARTRLLVLSARVSAATKRTGRPPAAINRQWASMDVDPYSGRPFVYRAEGPEFVIYSVGPNLEDDGGETDASFLSPDLTLEVGLR